MTVTAKTNDVTGVTLDAQNTALGTLVSNAPANSTQYNAAVAAQTKQQAELVAHHLRTGRLTAHTVLAASVFGPTGAAALSIPASDITTTALQTNINAIVTTASPQQAWNLQLKDKFEREFLAVLIAKGYTTAANVLAAAL
jgi:hypothetical protein